MFSFFKKKGPPPLPSTKSSGPPPLPPSRPVDQGDPPIKWHSYVFAVSFVPHMLLESRKGFFEVLAKDGGINLLWLTAGAVVPSNLQRLEDTDLSCQSRSGNGYLVHAIKLPKIKFPFEVQYCVSILGPCKADGPTDAAWETAEFRHFYLLAGFGGLEIKQWRPGGSITRGMWNEDLGIDAFVTESWKLSSDPRAAIAFVRNTDDEMNAAMARARREFPEVIRRYQAGELKELGLKVALNDGITVEHFWLSNARVENERLVGNIEGPVKSVTNVKDKELVSVDTANLSDWSYMKDGKLHGSYTLRVLLPTMNPSHAAKIRAMLADD